jgi:hypothetical protein
MNAADHWNTENVFAALLLPGMGHEPVDHLKVCQQAADRLFELERDARKRRKYLGFIETEGRLGKEEVVEFNTWLFRESRWRSQMMDLFEEAEAKAEAKGKAEGRAEGKAEGKAGALLRVLSQRGVRLTGDQVREVEECHDLSTLDRWLDRAAVATAADEVFGQTRH